MLLSILLLLVILFLLILLSMVWPPDSPWAPWWRTNTKTAKAICELAKINNKDTVYDLGCGDGEVLIQAAKRGAKGVGIEIDPLRVFIARLRVFINNFDDIITIKRNNFFNEKYSQASVIIVYLIPKTLDKLLPRFKKQLKKGTRIVSFRYEMKMPLKKVDEANNIRLYII
ncbi:MAG: 50S ribosomal protein L11 methyltransferase [Candidatus Levybacteria bacterium]|nr:50S ribosomal protein L11 methyltransferase [Candidatus Levybacteria bacterium]